MSRRITISDEAYRILRSHASEYQETFADVVDELCDVRDAAWEPTFLNPGAGKEFKWRPRNVKTKT